MSIVLKKGNFKKPKDRRWLFECGHCHSDFAFAEDDIHVWEPTKENNYKSGCYVICPVCGKDTPSLSKDWITEGYVREIKQIDQERISVTDYDGVETIYTFESEKDLYAVAEFFPGFEFLKKGVVWV